MNNGGIYEVADIDGSHLFYWYVVSSENFYYPYNGIIKEILIDETNSVNILDYGIRDLATDEFYRDKLFFIELQNKAYIVLKSTADFIQIYEVYNQNNNPQKVKNIIMKDASIVTASNDFYYISGKNNNGNSSLIKINPSDATYSTLLDNQYSIFKMAVSADDVVTFNALRFSDGAIVLGTIDENERVAILDETLTGEVNYLERIN
ncbi:MAG: hypothetical protein JXR52_10060 [Bacteroidales bacterium]|nr:hypothetical protein [Bacteroidales bacterium]